MDFSTPLEEPTQNFTEYTKQVFTDPVNQLRIKQLGKYIFRQYNTV